MSPAVGPFCADEQAGDDQHAAEEVAGREQVPDRRPEARADGRAVVLGPSFAVLLLTCSLGSAYLIKPSRPGQP